LLFEFIRKTYFHIIKGSD